MESMNNHMQLRILFFYGVAILLGGLTGLVSSCFQLSISILSDYLHQLYQVVANHGGSVALVSTLVSAILVFGAMLMVRFIAPEATGSGVPEIEGTLLHERPIFWKRLLPVKFIGGVLAISAGMVLGREGPTIQMGGNLGAMLSDFFYIAKHRRDTLIAAGAAAGLAAAFNAPLAGVIFIIEEMRNAFNFSFTNFKMVSICCVASTIVTRFIMGSAPAIHMDVFNLPSLSSLVWFFLFGIVMGFAGLLYNIMLMKSLKQTDKLRIRLRFLFVIVVGGLVGYLSYVYPSVIGGGYKIIEQSLTMRPSIMLLLALLLIRFVMSMLCYTSHVPGGIFAPMLALGTLMGLLFSYVLQGSVDPSIHPGMFAVAGMGALFSAAVRAPLTGIVLVVEMTQNYFLILPLMVTCLTSTTVIQLFGNPPIYTQLLHRLVYVDKV
jgi:CIC family chloride channel protein